MDCWNGRRGIIIVLGITGKIASGKSTVSKYIEKIKKDVLVVDIDKVAKDVYSETPEVLGKLKDLFGSEIFDSEGDIIFESLAGRVFSSKVELEKLNGLMFPLIRREVKNILNENRNKNYIIIDAAVLFDCKLDLFCDYIILVSASARRRKAFLMDGGFSDNDAELRVKGQYIKIDKEKVTFIINNNGSKRNLLEKVERILENI